MRRVLLGLTLALALGACQATPDRSPCADVDCSGHGSCQMVSPAVGGAAVPTCSCDKGYAPTPSGMLCTPATDTSLCAGIDCSGHGSCVSVKGKAQCSCDSGYQLGSTGLSCADPCSGITCSGHGTCKQTAAGAACTCDAGYRTALGDKTTCERGTNVLVYEVLYAASYKLGRVQLDLTNQSAGSLVEQVSYGAMGSGQRSHTVYTLDTSEEQVTTLESDGLFSLRTVSNRRWTKAAIDDKGGVTTQLQRLDKVATVNSSYQGTKRPLPMPGAFEYPGTSYGCISPLFYILALQRYDKTAKDPQLLEVYFPENGQVSWVKVQAGKGATPAKPVLDFPEWQISAAYESGVPSSITFTAANISLAQRQTGMQADLNLEPRKSGTPHTPAALPTDHVESALSFSSSDGSKLFGTLTMPSTASGKVPAVLLVSDLYAHDRDRPFFRLSGAPLFKHLAAHLAHAGYASLRYDPRGRGQSNVDVSKVKLADLAADANAARTALAGSPGVDGAKIFVLTHGMASAGALTALQGGMVAKGYVGVAPLIEKADQAAGYSQTRYLELAGYWSNYIKGIKKDLSDDFDEITKGTYTEATYIGLPVTLWKDWLTFDGKAALAAFSGPVLVLRGEEDIETSGDQVKAAEATNKTNLSAKTLKGLTFTLSQGTAASLWEEAVLPLEIDAAALTALVSWLDANK